MNMLANFLVKIKNQRIPLLIQTAESDGQQRSMWMETAAVVLAAISVAVRYLYLTDSLERLSVRGFLKVNRLAGPSILSCAFVGQDLTQQSGQRLYFNPPFSSSYVSI